MNKENLNFKGVLYGIRSDFSSKSVQWSTQYAWLHYDNSWYLVKYRTPDFWVRLFPFLMNFVNHEIWMVNEESLFSDTTFGVSKRDLQISREIEMSTKKTNGFGKVVGLGLSGIFVVALYSLSSYLFSSNDKPAYLTGLLIIFGVLVSALIFTYLMWVISKDFMWKRMEKNTQYRSTTTLLVGLERYKKGNRGTVTFKIEFNFSFIKAYADKLFGIFLGLFITAVMFLPGVADGYDPTIDSSAGKATSGVILFLSTMIFIVGGYFAPFSSDQRQKGYLRIKNINIFEISENGHQR
ncbi:hypothetical protein ESZ50_07425 [Weissella muntiaci]|uniref:DUF443 family protein n=1 Tax=Weissella muntiaci TaxID=2508881 RepID=A0A6C2C530_9LACO|nr:hypothetical protein [Weissella muntiaci]TYC49068.1 hypothetical protein ESZ50_07425 [Weissella muntiaci]